MIGFLFILCSGTVYAAPLIVGGNDTDISSIPYQLVLETDLFGFWAFACGASIIGPDEAVTAAHCVDGFDGTHVRFRSGTNVVSEGNLHQASVILTHPKYFVNETIITNDIALVRVKNPFIYSNKVQPIELIDSEPNVSAIGRVSGYGSLGEDGKPAKTLQSVEIPIVKRSECVKAYDELGLMVEEHGICAGSPAEGKDSCAGDSGGPLAVNGRLAGIISWGVGCARPGLPKIHTNVAHVRDWLLDNLKK